jgi:hypothetical protein
MTRKEYVEHVQNLRRKKNREESKKNYTRKVKHKKHLDRED